MKTVFILVDALSSYYINKDNTPFLHDLSTKCKYIEKVYPSPGFCERTEIFYGIDSLTSGYFSAIGYLPEESEYPVKSVILEIANILYLFNRSFAGRIVNKYSMLKNIHMSPYYISPLDLHYFALTEDGKSFFNNRKSIFDLCENYSLSYTTNALTALSDSGRRTMLSCFNFVKTCIDSKIDFIPYYIGEVDSFGHQYRNNTSKLNCVLRKVDGEIQNTFELARKSGYSICILGDHGMVPVYKTVNVQSAIKKEKNKLKGVLSFLDSTYARFWGDSRQLSYIEEILNSFCSSDGIIINQKNGEKYGVPIGVKNNSGKHVYGDLIWCAKPGVLISPDYFNNGTAIQGMHGYLQTDNLFGTGCFFRYQNDACQEVVSKRHLSDIYFELCDSLGIVR